ncbi:HAD-like protein [Penicillium longicatenatum]|nr:HAD-like protein [Penicillium longicatenatum]
MQCEDGGWDASVIYQFGSTGRKIGNRGLTTALAVRALERSREGNGKRKVDATDAVNTKKARLDLNEAKLEYFVHVNAPGAQVDLMSTSLRN